MSAVDQASAAVRAARMELIGLSHFVHAHP